MNDGKNIFQKFWSWLGSIFSPTPVPAEVYEETTAPVIPEDFDPDVVNVIVDTQEETTHPDIVDEPPLPIIDYDDEETPVIKEASKYAVLIGINKYDPGLFGYGLCCRWGPG